MATHSADAAPAGRRVPLRGGMSKSELALRLFPDYSPGYARRLLLENIRLNRRLMSTLKRTGWTEHCKFLTRRQAELIEAAL